MPAPPHKTLLSDRGEGALGRPVVQGRGRLRRLVAQLDLHGMALTGPDGEAIEAEREALLVVGADHLVQLVRCHVPAVRLQGFEQLADRYTALAVERNANLLGLVPQHETQRLADADVTSLHDLAFN